MNWRDTKTMTHRCRLCQKTIDENSLFCGFCNAAFHRDCITDHLSYNKSCPVCKREIVLTDLHHRSLTPAERLLLHKIRKPQWPPLAEVPLFEIERAETQVEYKKLKKRTIHRMHRFLSQYLPPGTGKRFRRNRKGMLGLYMLAAAILIAILAPILALYDPVSYYAEEEYTKHPPTWSYPLGTDLLGADVYSQVIWGFRSALKIGLSSAALVGLIGTVVGLASGYYGGLVDKILQRISITFLVWPSIPLVALIVHSWGGYQAQIAIILGVAFTLWPTSARAIRAEVMSVKNRTFIEAAKVSGASPRRIIFKHIFPNTIHLTFLYMTIGVASALVLEATINFLGLGDASAITWGRMLAFSLTMQSGYAPWWTIMPPGMVISYMILSFFLITVGLRESMEISVVRF